MAGSDLAGKVGGATIGGLIGLAFGGPFGGVVGAAAVPLLEGPVAKSYSELFRARGEVITLAGSHASQLPPNAFTKRVLDDTRLQPLLFNILDVAARTGNKQKLATLGLILGEQVSDDNDNARTIEEDLIIVGALRDLEAPHVRLLALLNARRESFDSALEAMWSSEEVERAASDLPLTLVQGALGGLSRHGLVQPGSGFIGGTNFTITDFGRAMFAVLRSAGDTQS